MEIEEYPSTSSMEERQEPEPKTSSWPLLLAFISFMLVFSLSVFATGERHRNQDNQATEDFGDYRSLKGGNSIEKQLQDFVLHGTVPGCEGCQGPKATKSICSHSTARRLQAPEIQKSLKNNWEEAQPRQLQAKKDLGSVIGQLQDFLDGKPVEGQCPKAEPILSISMPVNLKEANGLSAIFVPMLVRAATSSVSTMMRVPHKVVSVTLSHPAEPRLLSTEEASERAEKGSKFNIVAEVSSPPEEAMKAAMGPNFLKDFQQQVSAALIQEGAEAGTGNFHQIAAFDIPVLEEKSSLDVEEFQSAGFGTLCASNRGKTLQPGDVEAKEVVSLRACARACKATAGCAGFQFGHAHNTCQLWKTGICRSEESVGPKKMECFRKCA